MPCANCGAPETRPPNRSGKPTRFCSERCARRFKWREGDRLRKANPERWRRHLEFVRASQTKWSKAQLVPRVAVYRTCIVCGRGYAVVVRKRPGASLRTLAVCGPECRRERTNTKARTVGMGHYYRAKRYGVAFDASLSRIDVCERDGWVCGLCGKRVDASLAWPHPNSASLDHVVPLSAGGSHTLDNVQCAHLSCNMAKGARWNRGAA